MSEEPVLLSGLTHYIYCPRRYALAYIDRERAENTFTVRGQQEHQRANSGETEKRDGVQILRALPLVSNSLGLSGVADVVEILADQSVRPVEYKSSKAPKTHKRGKYAEEIQLCAQAMCLEEMFETAIPEGFIYHAASHKRRAVKLSLKLRQDVLNARDRIREIQRACTLPPPAADERCQFCSLQDECEPFAPRDFPAGYDPFDTRLEP